MVVTWKDHLPFGEEIAPNVGARAQIALYGGADNLSMKFTGYESDNETSLNFAQARYHSATQGRFTSPDPLMSSARASEPQSWNRYSYTINNPLKYSDPKRPVLVVPT